MFKFDKEHRLFYIYGELDAELSEFSFELLNLIKEDKKASSPDELDHIDIVINSQGGILYETFNACNIIKSSIAPVHTYANGYCQSGAVLLLLSGTKKFAFPNTAFMMHSPIFYRETPYSNFKNCLKYIEVENKEYENFILNNSKMTKEVMKKIFQSNTDKYFSSDEALQLGIVDEVITKLV